MSYHETVTVGTSAEEHKIGQRFEALTFLRGPAGEAYGVNRAEDRADASLLHVFECRGRVLAGSSVFAPSSRSGGRSSMKNMRKMLVPRCFLRTFFRDLYEST